MAAIQIDMFEVQLGAGMLLQFRGDGDVVRVLADAGVHASGYREDHVHAKLDAAFAAFGDGTRRIDLIVGTHYDADHLTGLAPIVSDTTIDIGEAWLPPVANDTEPHAEEDEPDSSRLLALQLAGPNRREVLSRYLRAKAEVMIRRTSEPLGFRFRPEPRPELRALAWAAEDDDDNEDDAVAEAVGWFRRQLVDDGDAHSHADEAVDAPADPARTSTRLAGLTLGLRGRDESAGTARTEAFIRASAARDAINAASLAQVVKALKARGIGIRCADIDDGQPRRFIWSTARRRFEPNPAAASDGPELLLMAPSKGLIKKHWDRLPTGAYFAMARRADLPIRGITPSNQLSYVIAFQHEGQRVLVTGDAGCVDFKPDGANKPYYPKLLAGMTPFHVVQVAHHGGANAHFYRVLDKAGIAAQTAPIHFLLSHAVNDKHRPSDVFARFMELTAARTGDRLLFTSRPREPKVRDFAGRIHPVVGTADAKGDVRLSFDAGGWAVQAHAVSV